MKNLFFCTLLLLIVNIVGCTKEDLEKTKKIITDSTVSLNPLELKLVGKWKIYEYVDSTNMLKDGVPILGQPSASYTKGNSSDYFEFKNTRNNINIVGTDLKKKDGISSFRGMYQELPWWADESLNTVNLLGQYDIIRITNDSLILRSVLSDATSGNIYSYRCLEVRMFKL